MKRWSIVMLAAVCGMATAQDAPFDIGSCYSKMWTDERAALVVKRIGVGQSPIPLELRASKAKANAKEKASLEFVSTEMQSCQQRDAPNRQTTLPAAKVVIEEFEREVISTLAKVYAGDLTWGGFIDTYEKHGRELDRKLQSIQAEYQAMQRAQQAAEAQRTAQQAAAALAEEQRQASIRAENERRQYMAEQEARAQRAREQQEFMNGLMLLDAARGKPAPNAFGNNLSCKSQNLNGTVHTNCW